MAAKSPKGRAGAKAGGKGAHTAPTPSIGSKPRKVSRKSTVRQNEADKCDCNALFAGHPNGIVYWDGDALVVEPFPGADSVLHYVNGSLTWVNLT
jgi:hypothetical protein